MDADFRARLLADTDATLQSHRFNLTEAERAKVAAGVASLESQATERNTRLMADTLFVW